MNDQAEEIDANAAPPLQAQQEQQDSEQTNGPTTTSSTSKVRSPLNQYLHDMGERQRDAMEQIFHRAVDNSCLQSCGKNQSSLEDQMDLLMHCRQPLSFLPFFDEGEAASRDGSSEPGTRPYVPPRACEYCGASTLSLCPQNCQRPKLYFQKQKPPFCSSEGWDPITEYELPPEEQKQQVNKNERSGPPKRKSSWVSGLFGGGGTPASS